MEKLDYKIVYGGNKVIALDGFSVKSLNVLKNTITKLPIDSKVNNDDYDSLDDIRSLTKKFYIFFLIDINKTFIIFLEIEFDLVKLYFFNVLFYHIGMRGGCYEKGL